MTLGEALHASCTLFTRACSGELGVGSGKIAMDTASERVKVNNSDSTADDN